MLGITTFDREGNQSVREKLGVQEIVRETERYQKSGYNTYTEWSETGHPSRHCSVNRKAGRPSKGWRDQLHLEG